MELHKVQQAALRASNGRRGFAYFMEQGLGKTLTSLADFMERVAAKEATRLVVICPNSFKGGWVADAAKHGVDVASFVWESGRDNEFKAWLKKGFTKPPMFVVNFEAVRSDKVQEIIKSFIQGRPSMLVVDESIKIASHNSSQTKSILDLAPNFEYRRILSGKPMRQGPHDLYAQMRAIGQLEGKNYYAFKTMFCKMGGFKMKQVVGAQNEEWLATLIDPHVFRATKVDWTDLPPKVYTERDYDMTPEMWAMYKQMEEEFVLYLESDVVTVDIALSKYEKLAQIQCGFIIDNNGVVQELVAPDRNPRVALLRDIIDNEVTGKVAIPYVHKYCWNILSAALADLNPAWIKGGMTSAEVEAQKDRFNKDPSCRVILLQTQAAKYGHTLLGGTGSDHCSTSIFFENSYSLDDRSQIEDRNHRHGQTGDSVLYLDLVGTPLDRKAIQALQRKESVFQAVFQHIGKRRG